MIDQIKFAMIWVKQNSWPKVAKLTVVKTIKIFQNLKCEMIIHKVDNFKVQFLEHALSSFEGIKLAQTNMLCLRHS